MVAAAAVESNARTSLPPLAGPRAEQSRGISVPYKNGVFGFPPQKTSKAYTGIHCHPGRRNGYPRPRKRQGKMRRLPNVQLRQHDYHLSASSNGQFYWRPPYPPRVNRTIPVSPDPDPGEGKKHKNFWPTQVHKQYPLKWRNIEYVYEPVLQRKPFGDPSQRWSGPVTRVVHTKRGKVVTQVTHDARLLDW